MTTLTDVYNDLLANGGLKTFTDHIQFAQSVVANANGTYTVGNTQVQSAQAVQFGPIPASNTAAFPPNSLSYNLLGNIFYIQIVGITADGTGILLKSLQSNGTSPRFPTYTVLTPSSMEQGMLTFSPSTTSAVTLPCFAAGTRIAVGNGTVAVEDIAVGDLVATLSGELKPVVWVGSRRVDIARHPHPENVRPVIVRAHAFGDGLPSRDLVLSPDHNVHVEGVLIPAKCLVNGRNVVLSNQRAVTYHHIELAEHDVVFAENLPTETYLDTGNRASFANAPAMLAHPDFGSTPDLNYFTWEARGFARLVLAGPELDRTVALLASRADAEKAHEAA